MCALAVGMICDSFSFRETKEQEAIRYKERERELLNTNFIITHSKSKFVFVFEPHKVINKLLCYLQGERGHKGFKVSRPFIFSLLSLGIIMCFIVLLLCTSNFPLYFREIKEDVVLMALMGGR